MNQQFEWMIKPTAQETWISGKGIIVWLAFAFGLMGAGSYLVSLFFGNFLALFLGWFIVTVLKNIAHLLEAKHPTGMWRMSLKPGTSWIARGTIFTALFSGFGFLQLASTFFIPGTVIEIILKIITGLMAVGIIIYEGCTLSKTRAIPFWNNAMVPVLFILWSIVIGFSFVFAASYNSFDNAMINKVSLVLIAAVLIFMILYLWGSMQAGETAAASVTEVVRGSLSGIFWVCVILIGIVVPAAILAYSIFTGAALSIGVAIALCLCEIIGGMMFAYCVFKAGKYRPLIDEL